jgi:AbrB family looped-hinge helix DNA binding protein
MARAKLRDKGQLTLPPDVRTALGVAEGDIVEFEVQDGCVTLHGWKMIPAEQAWFWTESWQRGEREASEDIAAGRTVVHKSADEFVSRLGD